MIAIILAYLLGSIPFGLLIAKYNGIDLRSGGSGNIGATNALRLGGKLVGILTLFGDFAKGALAIYVAKEVDPNLIGITAVAAVFGHIFPVWLKFRGGKGLATAAGVLLMVNINIFVIALASWVITFAITKISSAAALAACVVAMISSFIFIDTTALKASVIGILFMIILRHKDNIIRLYNRTESSFKSKK
jgi:glycerol-3-phosphate acyltransferase PlsY